MSNFEYISILVRRYFFYIGYLFLVVFLHLGSLFTDQLHVILFNHYIGYIFLCAIGYTHYHPKVSVSPDVLRWFYIINAVYYLLMSWYTISPSLDIFNQIGLLLIGVFLLYISIERIQKVLIDNMPNSEHDRKLRRFEMFAGKVDYFNHILERSDITDKQKLEFFKKELDNLK